MSTERFGFAEVKSAADHVRWICDADQKTSLEGVVLDGLILDPELGGFVEKCLPDALTIKLGDILRGDLASALRSTDDQEFIIGRLEGNPDLPMIIAQRGSTELRNDGIVDIVKETFGLRLMQILGAKTLVRSNRSSVLTPGDLWPGNLMLVHSDVDNTNHAPLNGIWEEQFGPRRPNMAKCYPQTTRDLIKKVAKEKEIRLEEGTYVQSPKAEYLTPEDVYSMRVMVREIWKEGRNKDNWDNRFRRAKHDPIAVAGVSKTYEAVAQQASQSEEYPAFQDWRACISVPFDLAANLGLAGTVPQRDPNEDFKEQVQKRFDALISSTFKAIDQIRRKKLTVGQIAHDATLKAIEDLNERDRYCK